jgi:hypothetical protein
LRKRAPAARDAHEIFAAARNQARATGRKVWILAVNPHRPASLRLARWLDDHRAQLERDYVLVKLVQGCDAKIDEVMGRLEIDSPTEPWSAITDAAGKSLAKNEGVFPKSPDDRDNFRNTLEEFARKLTPPEIDRLVQSLHD